MCRRNAGKKKEEDGGKERLERGKPMYESEPAEEIKRATKRRKINI